jgi:predicted lipid-binding transport protein (Tim44 family)
MHRHPIESDRGPLRRMQVARRARPSIVRGDAMRSLFLHRVLRGARGLAPALALVVALAGCVGASAPGPKAQVGAATGAAAGGLLGAALGGEAEGIIAGVLLGGLLGGALGNALDNADREYARRNAHYATAGTPARPRPSAPTRPPTAPTAGSSSRASRWPDGRSGPTARPAVSRTAPGRSCPRRRRSASSAGLASGGGSGVTVPA